MPAPLENRQPPETPHQGRITTENRPPPSSVEKYPTGEAVIARDDRRGCETPTP